MVRKHLRAALALALAAAVAACSAGGARPGPGEDPAAAPGAKNLAAAEATRNVGEAFLVEGNLIGALREFKKAEAMNPDDPITHYNLGLVYYYRERYDLAIQHLERVLKLRPNYAPAHNTLGNVYAARQEWDKAIAAYDRVIEDAFYATPFYPLSNMGLAYYHQKDYAQAEKHFLEALKLKPDFVNALAGLGMTYNATGRYSLAVGRLEAALKKEPKSPHLHFELGRACIGLGETEKARAAFAKTVELAPGTPLAADAQAQLRRLAP
jgi:tetratricopeptide (TPR) repeat protein